MKHIRNLYEQLGVDKYYKDYGNQYSNPHFAQIKELVIKNADRLNYHSILDFCSGGGEISLLVKGLGFDQITGSDPYTHQLYQKKLQQPCHKWSFDDVIKGVLTEQYSSIICSFAMHLCPEEKLYPLVLQLFQQTSSLVIITPHKRPILETLSGVHLDFVDHALTEKGKKVFLKHYTYGF